MRIGSLALKTLRDQRWQILGYGIALFSMALLIVFLWPQYRDTIATIELPPALEAFVGGDLSFSTAPGFLSAEYFSWIPILLIVFAVVQGTGAVAGEESSGTIDVLLAQPVRRRDIVVQKSVATIASLIAITAIGYAGFVLSIPFVDIDVSLWDAATATANMLPIAILFYAVSLWLGSVAPSRAMAAGIAVALVTAAYFAFIIGTGVGALSGLRYATPFYYYGAGLPLVHGIDWPHVALLLGLSALFFVLAVRTFEHRDVSVGGSSSFDIRRLARRAFGVGQS